MRRLGIVHVVVAFMLLMAACGDDGGTTADEPPAADDTAADDTTADDTAADDTMADDTADDTMADDTMADDTGDDDTGDDTGDDFADTDTTRDDPTREGEETEAARYAAATFSDPTTIDNEWLPLTPGTRITTEGITVDEGEELDHEVITTVTDFTKVIDGVETVVLWDQDFSEGELVETELAFFAQDDDGNVWRFGEYPEEYEDGELVEAPAWLAGLEDAVAGVAMLADPQLDTPSYSQGWGPEVDFNDRGQVALLGVETCVPFDCYSDVLVIDEWNVEEVGWFQTKYFASGVGNIRVGWRGADESMETLVMTDLEQLDEAAMEEVRTAALAIEESAYAQSEVYAETEPLQ